MRRHSRLCALLTSSDGTGCPLYVPGSRLALTAAMNPKSWWQVKTKVWYTLHRKEHTNATTTRMEQTEPILDRYSNHFEIQVNGSVTSSRIAPRLNGDAGSIPGW